MPSVVIDSNSLTAKIYEALEAANGEIDPSLLEHILTEVDHLLKQMDSMLQG
jgi:hypothetical protein